MTSTCTPIAGQVLPPDVFREIRLRTIFDCCKWDPQVEDVSTLTPFPLLISHETWCELAGLAAALAGETLAAEEELARSPHLLKQLALPRKLTQPFAAPSPGVARIMRFDFHLTVNGWRISEVNSDVPGGFIEASGFSQLMAGVCGHRLTADPASRYCDALAAEARRAACEHVGLVHATAFSDDRQVMEYLRKLLAARGITAHLLAPDHVDWRDGIPHWQHQPLAALARFFPAEWLANFRDAGRWRPWLTGSRVPLSNPATALYSQSKRLPFVWEQLATPMPTWRRLLPPTRRAERLDTPGPTKVIKPVMGRVGAGVWMHDVTPAREAKRIARDRFFFPRDYIVQDRFHTLPMVTPQGQRYACLGVYTIDGVAAGIYGRLSRTPIIDHLSQDVAVLIRREQRGEDRTLTPQHVEAK